MGSRGLAFAALDFLVCVTLWMLMQLAPPPKPVSAVKTYGTYAVILTWPKSCNADLDLYLRQPDGAVVYYNHVNGTVAHLEHDDIPGAGLGYRDQGNFERVVLRGYEPGEYVANVHVYATYTCHMPVRATVELWRLSGEDGRVTGRELMMRRAGDEQTAFRFSIRRNGDTYGVNQLERSLVG